MNWFGRLFLKAAGFPVSRSLSLTSPEGWGSWGNGTHSGKTVDEVSAMQVSTCWACIRVLAETLSSLPWAMYQRGEDGNTTRADNHPLSDVLINAPNADQTSLEFRQSMMTNLCLRGNAFAEITRTGGEIRALRPIESAAVEVKRLDNKVVQYVVRETGSKERTLRQQDVWHLKTFSRDGLRGLSPIEYARESLGLTMMLEEFGSKIFSQGLLSGAVIEFPDWIPDDKRALVEAKLERMYLGLINAGKPFLAEKGMKLSQAILPPDQAQYLELRGFGVEEICRIYRVPPHMVAKLDRATFSNIEQQSLDFAMYTMLPYLKLWEESVSKWLMTVDDRKQHFMRFNFEGLVRADSAGRSQLYSMALQNGWLSRNEVRELENRNRSDAEGMDDYTVQSNMALIDQLAALVAANSKPAAKPQEPPQ